MLTEITFFEFLIYFLSTAISYLGVYISSNFIVNNNNNLNSKFFLSLTIFSFFSTSSYIFLDSEIKIIISIMLCSMFIKLNFHINNIQSLFISLLVIIFSGIVDVANGLVLIYLFNINPSAIQSSLIWFSFCNLSSLSFIIIISFSARKKLGQLVNWIKTKDFLFLLILSSLLLLICINLFFNIQNIEKFGDKYFFNSSIILLLLTLILIFLKEKYQFLLLNDKFQTSKKYTQSFKDLVDDYAKRQHENNNELAVISGMIQMKSEKVEDYIKEIAKTKNNNTDIALTKYVKNIEEPGLSYLIFSKLQLLKDNNSTFEISINHYELNDFLHILSIKELNFLHKLIGVFSDNAIEAIKNSSSYNFYLEIYEEDDFLYIVIANDFDGKIHDVSNKGKGRGYGLKLIKEMSKKHSTITYRTSITDNIYSQEIMIKRH